MRFRGYSVVFTGSLWLWQTLAVFSGSNIISCIFSSVDPELSTVRSSHAFFYLKEGIPIPSHPRVCSELTTRPTFVPVIWANAWSIADLMWRLKASAVQRNRSADAEESRRSIQESRKCQSRDRFSAPFIGLWGSPSGIGATLGIWEGFLLFDLGVLV